MSELSKTGLIQLCVCILVLSGGCEAVAASGLACATARGNVSRAICRDQKLSRLNREMRGLYRRTLLLDDPAAELDPGGLARFVVEVKGLNCQLVLTSLSPALEPFGAADRVFHVEQGKVKST